MKRIKKITMIIGVAVIVSLFSLTLSVGLLGISNASKGFSVEKKEVWSVNIDEVSSIAVDSNTINIMNEPTIVGNTISYSLKLKKVNDFGQFQISIENDGNVRAKVVDIVIKGYEGYENNIDISLKNLNIGDIIETETLLNNIKVVTTYKEQLYDENMIPQEITLNNLSIEIVFEQID